MPKLMALARRPVFGRRIHIPAIHSKSGAERQFGERAAINAPIQGAAADIIRRAMIRMPGALVDAGLKTRMLLQAPRPWSCPCIRECRGSVRNRS